MTFSFTNLALLAGLAAVLIPPLVHLLHRRRYRVVNWGAMQFLQSSQRRQQRLWLEELLLMLLRMGLIALFVLALASPVAESSLLGGAAESGPRDILLLIDNSASMGYTDGRQASPAEDARAWIAQWVKEWRDGDRVAVAIARSPLQPTDWLSDSEQLLDQLTAMPAPRGDSDWPGAVEEGLRWLKAHSKNSRRTLMLLKDRQRFGWADQASLARWDGVGRISQEESSIQQYLVDVGPAQMSAPNFALAPLRSVRNLPLAGQPLRFTSALLVRNFEEYQAPRRLRLEINGQAAGDVSLPAASELRQGQAAVTFEHRFAKPGSYLISLIVEPGGARDALAGDNRQDLALEVVGDLPVLVIEGDDRVSPEGAAFFLGKALESIAGETSKPRVVPAKDWTPRAVPQPRVLILADVGRLNPVQEKAVEQLLADGGSVWVVAGERAGQAKSYYHDVLFRDGQGWLPCRLEQVHDATPSEAPSIDLAKSLVQPLQVFRDQPRSDFSKASFPRWWHVAPGPKAASVAYLTNGAPWILEQAVGPGRVLFFTAPLDRSWKSSLPGLPAFPILVHEIANYLMANDAPTYNLPPGQAFRLPDGHAGDFTPSCALISPTGKKSSFTADHPPYLVLPQEGAGPYQLVSRSGKSLYFVSTMNPGESDLETCTEKDYAAVMQRTGFRTMGQDPSGSSIDATEPQEVWWMFLLGVAGLLLAEIWLTRRQVKARTT